MPGALTRAPTVKIVRNVKKVFGDSLHVLQWDNRQYSVGISQR